LRTHTSRAFTAGFATSANANWFRDLSDARFQIARWRGDYNEARPHTNLDGLTPRNMRIRSSRTNTMKLDRTALSLSLEATPHKGEDQSQK
jgi:hypothetical protein